MSKIVIGTELRDHVTAGDPSVVGVVTSFPCSETAETAWPTRQNAPRIGKMRQEWAKGRQRRARRPHPSPYLGNFLQPWNTRSCDTMSKFAERVACLVLSTFNSLPQKSKPRTHPDGSREWIPMTGIVLACGTLHAFFSLRNGRLCR
jgi:hypothetical protein